MYHQIVRNKRNSVIVIALFRIVWLLAGFVVGGIAYGGSGGVLGAIVLGLLGICAPLFSYYLGSATVLSPARAQEADPGQNHQRYNIAPPPPPPPAPPPPKTHPLNPPTPNASPPLP